MGETLIEREDLEKLQRTRIAETFDEAIILGLINEIRDEGKYEISDVITHRGNLVFDIEKKDGSRYVADILGFEIKAGDIEIVPLEEFKEKGIYFEEEE